MLIAEHLTTARLQTGLSKLVQTHCVMSTLSN